MKTIFPLTALIVIGCSFPARADEPPKFADKPEINLVQEADAEVSYTGGARTSFGGNGYHTVDELDTHAHYIISPEITPTLLPRFGLDWERFSFGLPSTNVPLPNTLQSVAAVIGTDYSIGDKWLIRFEAMPGCYSDGYNTNAQDINVPMILGGSYLANENLQWAFGISIDPWRKYPVLPGAGVRWQFDPQWVLDFILPKPRLEYEITKNLHTYVGGEIKEGTYRVHSDFGNPFGQPGLNGSIVDYTEYRVGAGLTWKLMPSVSLEAEAGEMLERSFDYYRAGDRVGSDPAPYAQLAVKASF